APAAGRCGRGVAVCAVDDRGDEARGRLRGRSDGCALRPAFAACARPRAHRTPRPRRRWCGQAGAALASGATAVVGAMAAHEQRFAFRRAGAAGTGNEQGVGVNIVRRAVPEHVDALIATGMHPVLARIYAARGVRSSEERDIALVGLPTYSSLRGIEAATQRLVRAIEHKERIVVVADYDADGATACAIAVRGLHALGADVAFAVPNRFEHGYGLTAEIVAHAAARSPQVIVTVDNGIASHEGVAAAAARGIDVVITDHHLPAATLPEPAWIVNPNQPGCAFPCKHLAGVGVMFYVLLALRATLRARGHRAAHEVNLASLLDIVALGTVADVVRLDRVNRTLVAQGLRRIRAGRAQPGVHALLAAAGRDPACA